MSEHREKILDHIETTLKKIKKVDGYINNIRTVDRQLKHWNDLRSSQFPALFVNDGTESFIERVCGGSSFQIVVTGYIKNPRDASKELNTLISDTKKVLRVDPTRNHWALNTKFIRIDTDEGIIQPYGIFRFTVECEYRSKIEGG